MTSHSLALVQAIAVLPGPQALVLRAHPQRSDQRLELWDLGSGERLVETSAKERLAFLLAASDGIAATAGTEGVVRLWSLPGIEPLGEVDLRVPPPKGTRVFGHENQISCLALVPGSRRAVVSKVDRIAVWDLEARRSLLEFGEDGHWPSSLIVVAGGARLLTASSDRSLRLWDLESGRCVRKFMERGLPEFTPHLDAQDPQSATDACVLADGRRAVSTHGDGKLRCWDLDTGSLSHKAQAATGVLAWMSCVAAHESGKQAIAGGFDRRLWLWNPGSDPVPLEGHIGEVTGVAFVPGTGLAVSCSFDQTIRVWDVEERMCVRVLGTPKESSQWPPNESKY